MRNCFVPDCDAMHRAIDIIKRMMFMPPKDAKTFALWKAALTGRREFKATDRVCERHFNEEDIETHWDHVINGQLHKLKRGKPKLRSQAVPKLFLESCHTAPSKNGSVPKLKELRLLKRKKISPLPKKQQHSAPIELIIETSTNASDNEDRITPDDVHMKDCVESAGDTVDSDTDDETTRTQRQTAFETLYDDVFEVELPCTSYGVHRDPERTFIAFSRFNPTTLSTDKAFFVDNRLRTKLIIDGITVEAQKHLKDLPVDKIIESLNQLDKWQLCERKSGGRKCRELAVDGHSFCSDCAEK